MCWTGYCSFNNITFSLHTNHRLDSGWKAMTNTKSRLCPPPCGEAVLLHWPCHKDTASEAGLNCSCGMMVLMFECALIVLGLCVCVCSHACSVYWYLCCAVLCCVVLWCDVIWCVNVHRWRIMPSIFVPQRLAKRYSPMWHLGSQTL